MLEKELLNELKLYKAAVIAADQAEAEMLEDYTSEEKEAAFDKAYEIEYDHYIRSAQLVVVLSNEAIDIHTAQRLVCNKTDQLIDLLTA